MKNILLIVALIGSFCVFNTSIKAQEEQGKTYQIINNETVKSIQPYIDAMNNSDMKYHRLRNKRNTITFNTGVSVQLFSATELVANGKKININDYPENFDPKRDVPAFSLGSNNFIMEMHHVQSKYH